jgi:pimeloyl-ACP methyl ester carboxylesterase
VSVELAYERFGDPAAPPVLLIMGLGTQMVGWHADFCALLAERGLHVIRFDNRDVGLSTHMHDAPAPDVAAAYSGDLSSASYTLWDMASDTVALLDELGIERAHVVGASMGGMIAQCLAIEHPSRLLSLTSIMSTTGDPSVGTATEAAMGALLAPPARTREEAIQRAIDGARVIGSPGLVDEAAVAERSGTSFDRSHDPAGVGRQLVAIVAGGDRTERLRSVDVPTLVIHGAADPLVGPSGGEATAAAIPGARLELIAGMGHDLPRPKWPQIIDLIAGHVRASSGS